MREVERLRRDGREKFLVQYHRLPTREELRERLRDLEAEARRILSAQNAEGRWIEDGEIRSRTFIRHIETLANCLATLKH